MLRKIGFYSTINLLIRKELGFQEITAGGRCSTSSGAALKSLKDT